MHQLILLRHAKSSWDDPALPDRDRPLNGRGRRAAAAMRTAMRDLGLAPDVVLVSPARRTMETLAALEPWDDAPLTEPMERLYLADAATLIDILQEVRDTVRAVLVIGHNPGLHDLALSLIGTEASPPRDRARAELARGFPTGALAELTVPGPWHALGVGGAQLARFLTPRQLDGTG